MSDLIALVYPSEPQAEAMRKTLLAAQKEFLIGVDDAVVVERTQDGGVKLHQMFSMTGAGGAAGGFWGLLVGLIFMAPLAGALVGAAAGAVAGALTDFGVSDKFMKELGAQLAPGNAALFILVSNVTTDKLLEAVKGSGGTILQTSLDRTKEQQLRDALAAASSKS